MGDNVLYISTSHVDNKKLKVEITEFTVHFKTFMIHHVLLPQTHAENTHLPFSSAA